LKAQESLENYTVVVAKKQLQGRGQMGTQWQSEASKNLTASIYAKVAYLEIHQAFYISMATSLALLKVLREFHLRQLYVKWPNDILADNLKIAGILIENSIKNTLMETTIIGIGLNVNQTQFGDLSQATSLKSITGVDHDLDQLLKRLAEQVVVEMKRLETGELENVKNDYEAALFRKDKPSTFQTPEGHRFSGFINGVTELGLLQIRVEDNILKTFDLKDIKLLF
jgi:BirA family biotin operon repressor/biotin-[acetyl-CoA-carboxylase] ligase